MKKTQLSDIVPDDVTASLIIPLYGFWKDANGEQLTMDILKFSLYRVVTSHVKQYVIFVGEMDRLPEDIKRVVSSKAAGGNVGFVDVPKGTPYAMYVKRGIDFALGNTKSRYILVYNPWIVIRHGSMDSICERLNKEDVTILSSYDLQGTIDPKDFDSWTAPLGYSEIRDMNPNLWGIIRPMAEMIEIDPNFKTHYFFGRDLWQQSFIRGYEVITSQLIPSYSLQVDWSLIEDIDQFEDDRKYFVKKWNYDPSIKYK
jgi:hypothetical protein